MKKFLSNTFINKDVQMKASDWFVDIVIAIGVFGVSLAQLTMTDTIFIPDSFVRKMLGIGITAPTRYALAVIATTSLPLIFRRRYSWATFIVCLFAWIMSSTKGDDSVVSIVPLLISLVTLCAMRPMEDSFIAALVSFLAVGFLPALTSKTILTNLMLVQNVSLVFAGAGVGVAFKTSRDLIRSAEMRVEQAEKTAKATTEKRLEEERVAIARELHDITAHSLTAISIQAAAAEAQFDQDPKQAKSTIEGIRKISKDSLKEIRRMIGVLREPTDAEQSLELAPNVGTEELSEIEEYLKNAGIGCSIEIDGYEKEKVPGFVDIAIFGICREATTNIVKHANASNVEISISFDENKQPMTTLEQQKSKRHVMLRIRDDGVGLKDDVNKAQGHGVEGMRERCVALGGTFEIRNAEEGGTMIEVVLPVKDSED